MVWLGLDAAHQPRIHAQRYLLPDPMLDFVVGPESEVVLNNYVALEEAPAPSGYGMKPGRRVHSLEGDDFFSLPGLGWCT